MADNNRHHYTRRRVQKITLVFLLAVCVSVTTINYDIITDYVTAKYVTFHHTNTRMYLYNKYGGATEFEQYSCYREHKFDFPYVNYTLVEGNYNHVVRVVNTPLWTSEILTLQIREQFDGKFTRGGSNFHISLQGPHELDTCYYKDYFNGEYLVECPLFKGCNVVTVELDYVHFDAFRDVSGIHSIQKPIHTETICVNDYRPTKLVSPSSTCKKSRSFADDVINMVWTNTTGRWKLSRYGCGTEVGKSVTCFCKSTTSELTGVGASHMRYNIDWILKQCRLLPQSLDRKHGTYFVTNLLYMENKFVRTMYQKLERMVSLVSQTRSSPSATQHYIPFQIGAHDLAYNLQSNFMSAIRGKKRLQITAKCVRI